MSAGGFLQLMECVLNWRVATPLLEYLIHRSRDSLSQWSRNCCWCGTFEVLGLVIALFLVPCCEALLTHRLCVHSLRAERDFDIVELRIHGRGLAFRIPGVAHRSFYCLEG